MASAEYTAKDITVLEGLEPVRKRPGMYIGGVGSTGLHHLVWEILDNSIDEAMNGFASNIRVVLHADGSHAGVSTEPGQTYVYWKSGMETFAAAPRVLVGP